MGYNQLMDSTIVWFLVSPLVVSAAVAETDGYMTNCADPQKEVIWVFTVCQGIPVPILYSLMVNTWGKWQFMLVGSNLFSLHIVL